MKPRVISLFDLARIDAEDAERCLASSPNNAAFHAQQCAEKSLKAFLLELSDIKDHQEEQFLREIGHDSVRTLMRSVGQILRKTFERSHYESYAEKFRNPQTPAEAIAATMYQMFPIFVESVIQQINELSAVDPPDAWDQSFDENLRPELRLSMTDQEKRNHENAMGTINTFLTALGLPTLTQSNFSEFVGRLTDVAQRFETQGQTDIANALRNATKEVNRITAMIPWLAICSWAPYLDAHVVASRYADPTQLEVYKSRIAGVRNLVDKSKQIMKRSEDLLAVLTAR
jgi:HEPN domain-containing protein